jgi:putative aldouronate transport system permease protein
MDTASRVYTVLIYILVTLTTLVLTYPLYFVIIASFSDPNAVALGDTIFWFKGFTVQPYLNIMKEESLLTGYKNSFIYMIFGTIYQLVLTILAGYVCSKRNLPGHKFILWFFFITMYIGGGTIPTYITIKNLKLLNNPLVMIINVGVSAYYMLVVRQFFSSSIPNDLYEAAEIDGASEFRQFLSVALPLSKPIIAVIALYYAFGKWNSFYTALLYLKKQDLWPLQLVLRNILIANETALSDLTNMNPDELNYLTKKMYMVRAMKYAVILVASLPMMFLYPFVSKYFTQGVMIGSVKG